MTPGNEEVNNCPPAPTIITVLAGLSLRQPKYLRHAGGQQAGEQQDGGEHDDGLN